MLSPYAVARALTARQPVQWPGAIIASFKVTDILHRLGDNFLVAARQAEATGNRMKRC